MNVVKIDNAQHPFSLAAPAAVLLLLKDLQHRALLIFQQLLYVKCRNNIFLLPRFARLFTQTRRRRRRPDLLWL
jgi:hypothetical protein